MTTRILSGVRPTGNIHLGNYLGAIQNWVSMSHTIDEHLFCIVDQHALTTAEDASDLYEHTRLIAAAYVACGIDPDKSYIFAQNHVPGHTELAWYFNCITPLGWLNRMTQFKDKAGKNKEHANLGLYAYPVLMAADILLYKATHVPVGEDQKQHVELARDIAHAFNNFVKRDVFTLPEPVIPEQNARIMSLRDGTKKMSKSDISDYSRIHLLDDDDTLALKIRKAKTDMDPIPGSKEGLIDRPEAKNLIGIYAALSDQTVDAICTTFEGKTFSALKATLTDALIEHLRPIREKLTLLLDDKSELDRILARGADRANELAAISLNEVRSSLNLYPRSIPKTKRTINMRRFSSFLLSTPIQLLSIVLLVVLFASHIPHTAARGAYTISLLIKDLLLIVLPVAVASYIASTLISFKQNAILLVIALLTFEAISNATSVMYAYTVATSFENWIPVFKGTHEHVASLTPYFTIGNIRPSFWSSTNGVLTGAVVGIIAAFCKPGYFSQTVFKLRDLMGLVFSRIFIRLIPFYVLGFLLYMHHSGLLTQIIHSYAAVMIMITMAIVVYLLVLTIIASEFKKDRFLHIINNLWPAGVIAFTSMSSAATMPFTISATEKNLKNPKFAGMLIPATTNIQQIGDCIANALLCLVILKNFGKPIPDMWVWIPFMASFTLARYTTAAVLGGAIFIMIPLYEFYLGFTPEMVALILALNVVLDPIITSTNVLCNGVLAIIFERVWLFISGAKDNEHSPAPTLTIEYPYTREEAEARSAKK